MSLILDKGLGSEYSFPSDFIIDSDFLEKRVEIVERAYQHGGVITSDEKFKVRPLFITGQIFEDTPAEALAVWRAMLKALNGTDLKLYDSNDDYYWSVRLMSAERDTIKEDRVFDVGIELVLLKPFHFYKDETTDTSYLSQALSLNGSGYASIADASQAGLDMGLSDFMLEAWVKLNVPAASQPSAYAILIEKRVTSFYQIILDKNNSELEIVIHDGSTTRRATISSAIVDDLLWHYVVCIADRSSSTGLKIYVDGSETSYILQEDPTTVLSLDNAGKFMIGARDGGTLSYNGLIDEVRIWNFGYNGLPADYAAYITWRYANPYAALSSYDSDAWAGYADAYRIERITYGDLDDDNSDFEGAGADGTDISTNTDWIKANTAAEIDDEAGSGVTTYNGSTYCCKIHTAPGNTPRIYLTGANLDAAFTVGCFYEISFDYKVLNCTSARARMINWGSAVDIQINLTSTSWVTTKQIFQLTDNTNVEFYVYSHFYTDETGNEVVWIDNISVKRVGLVAHWKFNDVYTDETTNANDLVAGGSGNAFILESLPDGHPLIVNNDGDVEVHPVITLTGGASTSTTNVRILNANDSSKYFDYSGTITTGDIIIIDCLEGTVTKNGSNDLVHFLGSFLELASGNNAITTTVTGTVGTITLLWTFRKRYL